MTVFVFKDKNVPYYLSLEEYQILGLPLRSSTYCTQRESLTLEFINMQ